MGLALSQKLGWARGLDLALRQGPGLAPEVGKQAGQELGLGLGAGAGLAEPKN